MLKIMDRYTTNHEIFLIQQYLLFVGTCIMNELIVLDPLSNTTLQSVR